MNESTATQSEEKVIRISFVEAPKIQVETNVHPAELQQLLVSWSAAVNRSQLPAKRKTRPEGAAHVVEIRIAADLAYEWAHNCVDDYFALAIVLGTIWLIDKPSTTIIDHKAGRDEWA